MNQTEDWDGPVIWECRKPTKAIRVRQRRYRGSDFLDFREFTIGVEGKPTIRGATVPLDSIGSLVRALVAYQAERLS